MRKPPVHLVRWSSRLLLLLAIALPISIDAQRDETSRSWNRPVKPFRIISNVYYVGAFEVSAFLITTPQGHILLDSGFAETVPQIRDNLKRLTAPDGVGGDSEACRRSAFRDKSEAGGS